MTEAKDRLPSVEVVINGKTYLGYEITRQFVQTALLEQTNFPPPTRYRIREGQWNRDLAILERYVKTDTTLHQLGQDFYLTREGIRVVVSRTMHRLWLRCSPSIKSLFPLSELPTRKQESSQRRAISLSEALGGRSVRVAKMLKLGKSWQEIQEELGLNRSLLKASLNTIAGWGLATPELPTPTPLYQKLANQLTDLERTDTDMQQTLDQIPPHFYKMERHRPQPLLTTIGELLGELGFHYWSGKRQMQQFVDILTAKNIPLGEVVRMVKSGSQQGSQRYRFIATIHKERAREVLVNEPTLQSFHDYSVRQVAGPNYPCPTTYRLRNKQDFIPCGPIFEGLGITAAWRGKLRQQDFWTNDCPVPVFHNKRMYYCLKTQAEALKSFIQQKLPSLVTSHPQAGSKGNPT